MSRTCTSTRSSTRTASSSCTPWRKARRTAATACRSRSSPACPGAVIRAARRRLVELEEQGLHASPQRDLFTTNVPEPEHAPTLPALELLRSTDPDSLTPRAALELVYQLRQKLDE